MCRLDENRRDMSSTSPQHVIKSSYNELENQTSVVLQSNRKMYKSELDSMVIS